MKDYGEKLKIEETFLLIYFFLNILHGRGC